MGVGRPPAGAAHPAPGRLVDLGDRAGGGGQPDHQPAPARCWCWRARRRRGQPPQRRPVGPGLQVLPVPGPRRDRHPGGVPLGVRRRRRRPRRCTCCSRLPHIPLPSWAAGVQIGGPVTLEGTVAALYDGLRLGTLLCCLGAANALANPKRALRVLPGALYELGVAVVVALSVAPQLVESVQRVAPGPQAAGRRHAAASTRCAASPSRSWRTPWSGRCGWPRPWTRAATAAPARHPGGHGGSPARSCLGGMCGLCLGAYGLLDGVDAPVRSACPASRRRGAPVLRRPGASAAAGCAAPSTGPIPGRLPEWSWSCLRGWSRPWCSGRRAAAAPPASTPRPTRSSGRRCPSLPALAILVAALAAVAVAAAGPSGRPGRGREPAGVVRPGPGGRAVAGPATAGRRCRHDRLRPGDRHLRRRRRAGAARRRPAGRRGRAGPGGRTHRGREVHPARGGQRAGAPLHRGHAGRAGGGRRARHADPPAAGAGRRGRGGRPGPAGRLRHRHRRGGAGLRHGAAGRPARGHAQAGRGDARPAGHRRAPGPAPLPAVGRPAAAGGHRLGADRPSPRPGPRRADLGPRSRRRPRRCWPPSPGWSTTSGSPCCWPSTGWSGWSSTPTGSSRCRADGSVRTGPPADHARPPPTWHHRWSSWAGWPDGSRCRCRSATPVDGPGRCAERIGRPAGPAPAAGRSPATGAGAGAAGPQRRRPLRAGDRRPGCRPRPGARSR